MSEPLFKEILGKLNTLNQRVESLEEGQNELKSDVSDLKKGQSRLENRMDSLDNRMENLDNRMDSLDNRMENLENRMENLEHKTDRIDSGLLKLESRMENEVIDKIRGLYDDRSVNQDYFASIRNNQARIEEKLDILVSRAIKQDRKLYEHGRELRLLRIKKQ